MRILSALFGTGLILLIACSAASNATPDVVESIKSKSLFFEAFDGDEWQERWKHSSDSKYNGRFDRVAAKDWTDTGIKIPEKNKFYGLSALLAAPVDPVVAEGLPLVVQYEVKYEGGINCGGSYLKLLTADPGLTAEGLLDSTPYSIMFGPDRCGGPGKVHLILRHRNAVSGSITEKHLAAPPAPEANDYTHVYTLKIFPDHKYEVLIDGEVKSSGGLLDDGKLAPPLVPPQEVLDPADQKPADWVELSVIADPTAVKPDNWDDREQVEDEAAVRPKGWQEDESHLIDDPAAKKPEDWDEEEDGVWEPNQIPNPKCKVGCGPWKRPVKANPAYKGLWKAAMIPNPDYKGPWVQRKIPNPDFYEDDEPLRNGVAPIGGVALELWTVDVGYMFDNILITRDPDVAELALQKLWKPRHDAEVKTFEAVMEENKKKEVEREKVEVTKKKEERRKARKGGRHDTTQLEELTEKFLSFFEPGAVLAPLAPYLARPLDWLRETPEGSILIIGVTPMLILTFFMLLRLRSGSKEDKKARQAAAAAKKTDAVVPDDEEPADGGEEEVPAEEGEEDGKDGDAPAAAPAAEEGKAEESKEEGQGGDEEEKEEEEEEDEPSGPRRRTRRDA